MSRRNRKKSRKLRNEDHDYNDSAPEFDSAKWNPPRGPRRRRSRSPSDESPLYLGHHIVQSPATVPSGTPELLKYPPRERNRAAFRIRNKEVSEKDIKFRNFLVSKIEDVMRIVKEWMPEVDLVAERRASQLVDGRSKSVCIREDEMMDWQPETTLRIEYREAPYERDGCNQGGSSSTSPPMPVSSFGGDSWSVHRWWQDGQQMRPDMSTNGYGLYDLRGIAGGETVLPGLSDLRTEGTGSSAVQGFLGGQQMEARQMISRMQGDDWDDDE